MPGNYDDSGSKANSLDSNCFSVDNGHFSTKKRARKIGAIKLTSACKIMFLKRTDLENNFWFCKMKPQRPSGVSGMFDGKIKRHCSTCSMLFFVPSLFTDKGDFCQEQCLLSDGHWPAEHHGCARGSMLAGHSAGSPPHREGTVSRGIVAYFYPPELNCPIKFTNCM